MNAQIIRMIEKGKPISAISKLVKIEFEKQDKAKWLEAKQAEYDVLFPATETVLVDEVQEDGTTIQVETIQDIDYSDNPDYLSFNEWINETVVTTPAVYLTYLEYVATVLDSADIVAELDYVPVEASPEVTEMVRPYVANDVTALVDTYQGLVEYKAKLAKNTIDSTLAKLTVTTSLGKTFDSNLESRQNMADGILAAETMGLTENIWRLADNSEVLVGIAELREAHALALQAYAATKFIGV